MKRILKKINEESIQFTEKKETLKKMYEKLMQEQKDINELLHKADQIKEKDDNTFKQMLGEVKEKSEQRRENFDKYKKKKQEIENKMIKSKKAILRDLNYKNKLVKNNINKNFKDVDIKSLKKEEKRLRNEVKLIRVTDEEFKRLNSEQQKIVVQAKSDFNKNQQRLSEIREIINFIKLVGDKNPEDVLQQIEYAIEQVDNNFKLENIDKLVSFKMDDKNIVKEDKDKKGKNDDKKQEDVKSKVLDENTKRKIESNKKDILKYMKLINRYKDDKAKCNDFMRAIKDLQVENEKLYQKLKINDSKEEEKMNKEQHEKGKDINKEQHNREQEINEEQRDREENDEKGNYDNIFNKIDSNTKDILKYMKLINKYKDDKAKCDDFIRAINDLEKERKKLYDMLNLTKQKNKDIEQPSPKKAVSPNTFELQKENFQKNERKENLGIEKNLAKNEREENLGIEKNFQKNEREENLGIEKKLAKNEKEEILGIEQKEVLKIEQKDNKRPVVMFDRKTGNYIYIDENGKTTEYSHFFYQMTGKDGNKSGRYHEMIEKDEKNHMMKIAMSKGLTKKQAKMIDFNIYRILQEKDTRLLDKYIESLNGYEEFDKGFDIVYDLRKKGRDIERNIGIKNIRNISKKARKHEKLGIAKVYRDKSRALLYSVLGALGLAAVGGGTIKLLNSNNNEIEMGDAKSILEGTLTDEINKIKEDSKTTNKDNELDKEENNLSDFIKISKGAMLFNDPTDELRIMRGINANEKVTIKSNSQDRIYKVTKTGYYSPSGKCIEVEAGESLEEALKNNGLDKTFIEDENTIKMCHAVAEGVAQWVNVKDVENVKVRTDKFGNTIDKTEEEKEVEDAYENYMKQHSKINNVEQTQR